MNDAVPTNDVNPDHQPTRRSRMVVVLIWAVLLVLLGWVYLRGSTPYEAGPSAVDWQTDLKAALATAEERGVPVLANFTADWCPPCQMMRGEVYSDEAVGDYVNRHFVPVTVDLTQPGLREQQIAGEYGVMEIPTLLVLRPSGQPISGMLGYKPKDEFMTWLTQFPTPAPGSDPALGSAPASDRAEDAAGNPSPPTAPTAADEPGEA